MSPRYPKPLTGLALLLLLAAACELPPVVPTADRRQHQEMSRIEGQVVVQSRARGNVLVFLYDAQRPPPPQGSGRPVSFTLIPAEQLFGAALDETQSSGPFIAPFAFSLVPPGNYLLRGFLDADTCRAGMQPCRASDFIPWYGVTSEPNAGDVGGAAVDAVTRLPRVVEVTESPDGVPQVATGVTVTFSDSATVPWDRPAFQVLGEARLDPAVPLRLLELRPLSVTAGVVNEQPASFLVRYVDNDGNNVPDDADGNGIPDLWPRVVVRKLADVGGGLVDENDLDRNGLLDEQGADYLRADGTSDGEPDQVVLAAGLVPDALIAALTDSEGKPRMGPVEVPKLDVAVRSLALDASNPLQPAPLQAMASGRYALILVQFTGQTWRVPNELSPHLAPGLGLPSVENQAFVLEVP